MEEHDDARDAPLGVPPVRTRPRPVDPDVAAVLADGLAQIAAAIDEGLQEIARAIRPLPPE